MAASFLRARSLCLSVSLQELKPHKSKQMNNNAAKNPPYNHDLLVHKEFSRTKHKRKRSARFAARPLSLSLNNTLCLEIPLSKCELLQQRLAKRSSTGQAFSFFSSSCKGEYRRCGKEGEGGGGEWREVFQTYFAAREKKDT
jgi:hypothetical protein